MARETLSIRPEKWKSSHEPQSVVRPSADPAASLSAADKRWKSIHFYRVEDSRSDRPRTAEGGEILSTPRYEAEIPFQWVFHLSLL